MDEDEWLWEIDVGRWTVAADSYSMNHDILETFNWLVINTILVSFISCFKLSFLLLFS